MQGTFFSIEEFSVYDGPGIRTTVFLKGCPLKCSWCHNPEGQNMAPEIVRSENGCVGCGNCIKNGTEVNSKICFTQQSIKNCPKGLLRVCGEETESAELCEKLLKNRVLLEKGGVTFSGGEPFMQSEFLFECLDILNGKLHTAIQTSGYTSPKIFEKALNKANYFLFDLKIADNETHKKYVGESNQNILINFSALAKSGKDFVTRIPLIPGVTDTKENINGIIKILKENNVCYVELLPYNKMAGGKYKTLGREYCPDFNCQQEVCFNEEIFKNQNIKYRIL